tara:strand:+ start:109 stop:519 length:411 start_codon:yes stop_codon:yes gene_type:complete
MARDTGPFELGQHFVHLKSDATASALEVDETFWQDLSKGRFGNFKDEYLVSTLSFIENWPVWEMHPEGEEIIVLLSGSLDLILEKKSGNKTLTLNKSASWVLVPKGVWHTARLYEPSTLLFITPGEGTLQRPVDLA